VGIYPSDTNTEVDSITARAAGGLGFLPAKPTIGRIGTIGTIGTASQDGIICMPRQPAAIIDSFAVSERMSVAVS
jgi:hypothetical protein